MITAVQQKVLDKVVNDLGEHFPGFVLVAHLHDQDTHMEDCRISYSGGGYFAIGLLEKSKHMLMTRQTEG